MIRGAAFGAALLCAVAGVARADVPIEIPGGVETLPPPRAHWVLVSDSLLGRAALVDLESGAFLGMVSTGYGQPVFVFPRSGSRFYLPETFYSRGSRGARTDVVTIFDAETLAPVGEVEIPAKRAMNVLPSANAALGDDDRFLAVFNMTPATSLSIVDVERRAFVGEISTPGCSLVYPAGARRFLMLCADGALLTVSLDERGRERSKVRSEPFFDPGSDPVTEKAVRLGDTWHFVSFEGYAYPVDVSGETPQVGERWSLVSEREREAEWRIGGAQHLAAHEGTGRLYSLMHRGGADTHKQPGTELWVYDVASRERVQRIELRHPGYAFLIASFEFGRDWVWPFHRLSDWLLDYAIPSPGIEHVQVTPDAEPLLVTGSSLSGSLAIYDALSGEFLRRVGAGNVSTHVLHAPWGSP